jgi:hypothetical protein
MNAINKETVITTSEMYKKYVKAYANSSKLHTRKGAKCIYGKQ